MLSSGSPDTVSEGARVGPSQTLQSLTELSLANFQVGGQGPRFRVESNGFDLAAHFLDATVVSIDFMIFQSRNMRDAAAKLAGARFWGAAGTGVDEHSLWFRSYSASLWN
jgi:hypothetical protein